MKWKPDDIEKYEQAKEYFDTAIIPVHCVNLSQVGRDLFQQVQWIENIASYMEEQLMGRVFLLPAIFYYMSHDHGGGDQEAELKAFADAFANRGLLENKSFSQLVMVVQQPEMAKALQEQGYSVFLVDQEQDELDIVEIGKKGYQFLLNIWKEEN